MKIDHKRIKELLREGDKIRREKWPKNYYIYYDGKGCIRDNNGIKISETVLYEHNDWQIYKDTRPMNLAELLNEHGYGVEFFHMRDNGRYTVEKYVSGQPRRILRNGIPFECEVDICGDWWYIGESK